MTEQLFGVVLVCLALLIAWWLRGDYRRKRTWLGALWWGHADWPWLFWFGFASHAALALVLILVGLSALFGLLPRIGAAP
jgi:hypothetical protein